MVNPTKLIPADTSIVDLIPTTTLTASGVSDTFNTSGAFHSCNIIVKTGTVTGTSPTLNVYLQTQFADGTWGDIASVTQITGTKTYIIGYCTSLSAVYENQDAAMTVTTARTIPMGHTIRIKYVIGGTNPSFPTTVAGAFYKFQ